MESPTDAPSAHVKKKKKKVRRNERTNLFSLPHELVSDIFIRFVTGEDDDPHNTPKSKMQRAATLRAICKAQAKWIMPYMAEQTLVVMHEKRAALRQERSHVGMRVMHTSRRMEDKFAAVFYKCMCKDATAETMLEGLKLLVKRYEIEEERSIALYKDVVRMSDNQTSMLQDLLPPPPPGL